MKPVQQLFLSSIALLLIILPVFSLAFTSPEEQERRTNFENIKQKLRNDYEESDRYVVYLHRPNDELASNIAHNAGLKSQGSLPGNPNVYIFVPSKEELRSFQHKTQDMIQKRSQLHTQATHTLSRHSEVAKFERDKPIEISLR
eukprot:gb/GECH01000886.1/.p1 GENE.gb/GECH01000886.1/~~gb/GECH01000886.1/.p1  ORF type:complete len:144 (+),score=32.88 gb/GECH01000886.1/:1-432(+)